MTEFLESTGRTEAEAIEKALTKLNLDRDDVSVEVLSRAKAGFLGFGVQPAKVKITYEIPEPPKLNITPDPNHPPEETVNQAIEDVLVQATVEKMVDKCGKLDQAEAPKEEQITASPLAKVEKVEEIVPEMADSLPTSTPAEPEPPQVAEKVSEKPPVPGAKETKQPKKSGKNYISPEEQTAVIAGIETYLNGLLPLLHVEATPKVSYDGNNFLVNLEGENLGALIGRRGETLDAIQQMTGYSVNKICPKRIRIFMDAENYRGKRQETLIKLAEKVAGEAVKQRKNVPLEPMNAYERHIIHTALEKIPQVSTYSTGSDPNRRIVVAYRGKKND